MSQPNRVIVGEDDQSQYESPVAFVRAPDEGDDANGWFAWINDANNGPRIVARPENSELLITETLPGGYSKMYIIFFRTRTGQWLYSTGIVMEMVDGWLRQGSSSSRGKVVFDSSGILNRAIAHIVNRDIT
jgi:hypothetical protein